MEVEVDAHPLVAPPTILARGAQLPGPAGERRPSGSFGARSTATMLAVAEAVFSLPARPCPPERLAWIERELSDLMSRASPSGRLAFRAGALAVSVVAPLLVGKLPPFRSMPLPLRIEALRRFEARPIGSALIAVRAVLCLIYYEHPDAAREVGIEPGAGGRLR